MVAASEKSVASEASEESEDFEASDAYEESVQKGRETTELLTVCLCMDKPTNLLWRYVFMLRCSVTAHVDLELGPQAKGNNMRVGTGSSWKPQEAMGSQGGTCKSAAKPCGAKGSSWKPWGAKASSGLAGGNERLEPWCQKAVGGPCHGISLATPQIASASLQVST